MKVVMLAPHPIDYEKEPMHGVVEVTVRLSRAMAQVEGLSLTILTLSKYIQSKIVHIENNYKLIALPRNSSLVRISSLYYQERKVLLEEIESERPDLLHVQALPEYSLTAMSSNLPWVFTPHGITRREWRVEKGWKTKIHTGVRAILEPMIFRQAKNIISISPFITQLVSQYTPARIFEIPNPIDETFFSLKRHDMLMRRILFVGALTQRKGIWTLLEAFEKLIINQSQATLIIVGGTENSSEKKKLQKRIDGMRRSGGKIEFLGRINDQELKNEFMKATVLCLPSLEETAPMVIAQAMAVGLPVIASNVGGIPYMVEDGVTGLLVKPNDSNDLLDKLRYLFSLDERQIQLMGERAKIIAKNCYSHQTIAQKTYDSYKTILANKL